MAARTVLTILPQMTLDKVLDGTGICSVADLLSCDMPRMRHRPFNAPPHSISHAGLVGGGRRPHRSEGEARARQRQQSAEE